MSSSKPSTRRSNKKDPQEVLNSAVNLNGVGEDPVVKAMLSDQFVNGTNKEALDVALALQQLIRGTDSLLANQERFSTELNRLNERMNAMDFSAEKWEKDRQSFMEEVLSKAESLKDPTQRTTVKGALQMEQAIQQARAEVVSDRLKFEQELATMPRENVVSPGELVQVMEGGRPSMKIMNETVRIKHKVWTIPAGQVIEVPRIVAEVLRDRRLSEKENQERSDLLSKNLENDKLSAKWNEVNSKYKSPTRG